MNVNNSRKLDDADKLKIKFSEKSYWVSVVLVSVTFSSEKLAAITGV